MVNLILLLLALATAKETPNIALAPNLPLFSVPSEINHYLID